MPLFRLPVDSSVRPSARAQLYPRTSKKRKRLSSPDANTSDEDNPAASAPALEQPSQSASATNPLSLTPDEILQYKTAGLNLDQELPSKSIPDFPHRGLPSSPILGPEADLTDRAGSRGESEKEGGGRGPGRRAPLLRMRHLGVLTAVLHRCLLEGDIPRASRAWAMLLRAQINGRGVDIRSSGYWGIGAELLIRGGEKPPRGRGMSEGDESETSESDAEDSDGDEDTKETEGKRSEEAEWRWGTAAGLEKAKDYYERLILQHPYKRQYHGYVSSLDFWPAMLGCEIYGIQFEQKEALRRVSAEEERNNSATDDDSSDEDGQARDDDADDYFLRQQRREARQQERRRELFWKKRDEIRQTALVAAEKVAARMDEVMMSPPFADSQVLHRLRGMLALYVGDLSVPGIEEDEPEAEDEDEDEDEGDDDEDGGDRLGKDKKRAERRLLKRQRRAEHERGLLKRSEERVRARKAFEKAEKDGGMADGYIRRLSLEGEEMDESAEELMLV